MNATSGANQEQDSGFVNSSGVCRLLGLDVINPSAALWWYRKNRGFPNGVRIGRAMQWKVSQVLAWRENQHAMSN